MREFSVSIEREELDVTTLPCGLGESAGGKYASFRKTQAGYATGTGSMTVYFTDDDLTMANRMLDNVLLRNQDGAAVRLFFNTVSDGASPPAPDLVNSNYIEADIRITKMEVGVNPDDPQEASIEFSIQNPRRLFKTDVG